LPTLRAAPQASPPTSRQSPSPLWALAYPPSALVETATYSLVVGGVLFCALAVAADVLTLTMPSVIGALWRTALACRDPRRPAVVRGRQPSRSQPRQATWASMSSNIRRPRDRGVPLRPLRARDAVVGVDVDDLPAATARQSAEVHAPDFLSSDYRWKRGYRGAIRLIWANPLPVCGSPFILLPRRTLF